jgi:phenylalanyl-tRNA synthetase beta chain
MKFQIEDLHKYVCLDRLNLSEIVNKLNDIGIEVEFCSFQERNFNDIIIAKVITCEKHPNADKLKICKVSDGTSYYNIVCGAHNVAAPMFVVLAKIGARIPNGNFGIKKAKIRSIESEGMLCSASELLIDKESEGIIELNSLDDSFLGKAFGDLYNLKYDLFKKTIIEVKLTPNRGDAASIIGIARDLAAAFNLQKVEQEKIINTPLPFSDKLYIENKEPSCIFNAIEIRNIKNCESPYYIKERLKIAGIVPKNAVVDILNFVMLEIGQPMHCYDRDKIKDYLKITYSSNNEEFIDLHQSSHRLKDSILVVKDSEKSVSLAGVIGSFESAVTDDTKNIIIEAAYFPAEKIAFTGQTLKINSEARFRFERGVDNISLQALYVAYNLIKEICGDCEVFLLKNSAGNKQTERRQIIYDINYTKEILGYNIDLSETTSILERLCFEIKRINEYTLEITVPFFRHDISIKQDIAEEIARIKGYNNIVATEYSFIKKKNKEKYNLDYVCALKKMLCSRNMNEILTFSFVNLNYAELFANITPELLISNPISSEMSYMRNSLLIGLIQALVTNDTPVAETLSLFEEGVIFSFDNGIIETQIIAGVRYKKAIINDYFHESRDFDIFDVKADFIQAVELLGISSKEIEISRANLTYTHPSRSFAVYCHGKIIGYFGEVHPRIQQIFCLDKINFFEVNLSNIPIKETAFTSFKENLHQAIIREFSFIVDENIEIAEILNATKSIHDIKDIIVLDIYRGIQISQNKKSISLRYILQLNSGKDIATISEEIIQSVTFATNAILRDGICSL